MTTAEAYVTAAYLVFFAVLCLYVVIFAFKVARLEHELAQLTGRQRDGSETKLQDTSHRPVRLVLPARHRSPTGG